MFHFCDMFYCYLLFPCIQNSLISFFPLHNDVCVYWNDFYETHLGKRDRDTAEAAYKYSKMLTVILKLHS